jgi:hypothetical protein
MAKTLRTKLKIDADFILEHAWSHIYLNLGSVFLRHWF